MGISLESREAGRPFTFGRIPFEPHPSDVFLVGVMGSGITMLTQVAHGLRSKGDMSFDDINEVVPWFHAAQICGQDLDALQPYKPRLFKTHQLHEKLPEDAKFVVLFRDPRKIFLTRYRRYCNSSWTDYARVPRGAISLENFAVGIFGHESGNEVGISENLPPATYHVRNIGLMWAFPKSPGERDPLRSPLYPQEM